MDCNSQQCNDTDLLSDGQERWWLNSLPSLQKLTEEQQITNIQMKKK